MYKIFANREEFNYNIPIFDNLIQTPEMPASFILYQEMAMTALNFAGIPMSECYEIIKNISKKREDKVKSYKEQFLKGFAEKIIDIEKVDKKEANDISNRVWQIISDSSKYLFNASHSYCVSSDSLYCAYLKSHYPLEFYETFLRIMNEGNKKDRMKDAQKEAEKAFGIRFAPFRFRQDNRDIVADPDTNSITNTLKSIKGLGAKLGEQLYSLKDNVYDGFIDLLVDMEENQILCSKIEDLIKIQYFDEFGNNSKLLSLYKEFTGGENRYNRTHKEATKEARIDALKFLESILPNERIPIREQMTFENNILGYIQATCNIDERYVYVLDIDTKYSPKAQLYCLQNSNCATMKIQKKIFNKNQFKKDDIILIKKSKVEPQKQKVGDDFIPIEGTKEYWITEYQIVNNIDNIIEK
jgi:DNA polymerase III alpha subunit